jgi:hypothetical protein
LAAWLEPGFLLPNSENGKKPFEAGCAAGTAAAAAGGEAADDDPALARGAGVGSGTSCAAADAAAKTTHVIAKAIARAPDPIISLSRALRTYASPEVCSQSHMANSRPVGRQSRERSPPKNPAHESQ